MSGQTGDQAQVKIHSYHSSGASLVLRTTGKQCRIGTQHGESSTDSIVNWKPNI